MSQAAASPPADVSLMELLMSAADSSTTTYDDDNADTRARKEVLLFTEYFRVGREGFLIGSVL